MAWFRSLLPVRFKAASEKPQPPNTEKISLMTLSAAIAPIFKFYDIRMDSRETIAQGWQQLAQLLNNISYGEGRPQTSNAYIIFRNSVSDIAHTIRRAPSRATDIYISRITWRNCKENIKAIMPMASYFWQKPLDKTGLSPKISFTSAYALAGNFPDLSNDGKLANLLCDTYIALNRYILDTKINHPITDREVPSVQPQANA